MGRFNYFDHTADIGIEIDAPTLANLFETAVLGLTALIVADPARIEPKRNWLIELQAEEASLLMLDLLSEVLHQLEIDGLVVARAHALDASPTRVRMELVGEAFDPDRHGVLHEVKAITYHELVVERADAGWRARVIVDI